MAIDSPLFFLISAGVARSSGAESTLLLDNREGNASERLDADLLRQLAGDLRERARGGGLGLRKHDRRSGVAVLSYRRVERNLAEERDAQRFRSERRAAVTEDLVPTAAARANVVAHVLDHAQEGYLGLLEHPERLHRDLEPHVLGRRDDHG